MKKIISFILVAILCLGALTSCAALDGIVDKITGLIGGEQGGEETPTVEQAASYLDQIYKSSIDQKDSEDYDLVAKVVFDGKYVFDVTWTVDNSSITIKESSEAGYWVVDLPASNDTEVQYTLTATVKDANNNTATYTLTRKLAKYKETVATPEILTVAAPEAGVAYKLYLTQNGVRKHIFATHGIESGKWLVGTSDYTKAPDFFAEKVDGGYKFYTMIDGAKKYLAPSTTANGSDVSKVLGYADSTNEVWYYKAETTGWYVTINEVEYVLGTHGQYETLSLSESTFLTAENAGKTQFPAGFITAEVAASLPAFPELPTVPAPEADKGYIISADNKTDTLYFKGTITGGRFDGSTDKNEAVAVFLKETSKAGEFVLYFSIDDTVKFIKVENSSSGASLTQSISEASAFKWNANLSTMVVVSCNRAIGCQSTSTYENLSPYSTSNAYNWAEFTLVENAVKPEIPEDSGDQGGNDTPSTPTTITAVKPVVGTEYIMGLTQGTLNKILYLTSESSTTGEWYRATTTDASAAVKVAIEAVDGVDGAFRITYTVNSTKYYLEAYERNATDGKGSIQIKTTPTESLYYTFDETYNIPVVTSGNNKYYLGTYSNFETISCSNYSFLSAENVNVENFILVFIDPNAAPSGGNDNTDSDNNDNTNTTPAGVTKVTEVAENTEYLIMGTNANGAVYFSGSLTNGRLDGSADISEAVALKLESAGAAGEYYIYYMDNGTKTYIGANSEATSNKAAQFKTATATDADFVWLVDASAQTIISKAFSGRGFGTDVQSDKYTNFSTYASSNFSGDQYLASWFVVEN